MKILVIGLGQDGKCAVDYLEKNKFDYRVVSKLSDLNSIHIESKKLNRDKFFWDVDIELHFLLKIYSNFKFNVVLNFAANSFAQLSANNYWSYLYQNTKILTEIVSFLELHPDVHLFHPLSSEILESKYIINDDYSKLFSVRNAYGVSKVTDYWICKTAERSGLKISYPIIFNHESSYRSSKFFIPKLIRFIKYPKSSTLIIYNCMSVRDWGYAPEYIEMLINSLLSGKTGVSMLGSSVGLRVYDVVNYVLDFQNINFELEDNGLFKWHTGKFDIVEVSRSTSDAKRKVLAHPEEVEKFYGKLPQYNGKSLLRKLISDF